MKQKKPTGQRLRLSLSRICSHHFDIDLIVIPTPNDTHFPLAKAALEAGKHVVVDKPFTVTLSQARELDALEKPGACCLYSITVAGIAIS
ncbi:Gfo/Idh/MocA family oxidoreductase [Escherichia coli]